MTTLDNLAWRMTVDAYRGRVTDRIVTADNLKYTWDLKHSWMTINNWRRVTRAYLDPELLGQFERGEIQYLPAKDGHEVVAGKGSRRAWGACLLGWAVTDDHTLHMHSRTTIAGFMLPLDLAIGAYLAHAVGAERMTLHIDLVQIHHFKSMPWFLQNEAEMPPRMRRAWERLQDLDRRGVKYLDMTYAQECRFRRRLHTEHWGPDYGKRFEGGERGHILSVSGARAKPLPSHPFHTLTMEHLRG